MLLGSFSFTETYTLLVLILCVCVNKNRCGKGIGDITGLNCYDKFKP